MGYFINITMMMWRLTLIHYALYGIDENRQIKVANEDLANFNDLNKTNILFVLHEK